MNINDKLKQVIKDKGYSLSEVASKMYSDRTGKVGISQPALSDMLSGKIPFARVEEIAGIIGISLAELIADAGGSSSDFCAMVRCGGKVYCANTPQELRDLAEQFCSEGSDA